MADGTPRQPNSGTEEVTGPTGGHILWTRTWRNITPGPAIGAGGTIYVATNGGLFYALDASTGSTRWTFNGGKPIGGEADLSTTPLVLPSGDVLWPGSANTVLASPTGAMLWSRSFPRNRSPPPCPATGSTSSRWGGTLSALDIGTTPPQLAWSLRVGTLSYGSPVVASNGTIVTTADHHVIDVSDKGSSARILWSYATTAPIEVSASVGPDGTVVVSTNNHTVYALKSDEQSNGVRAGGPSGFVILRLGGTRLLRGQLRRSSRRSGANDARPSPTTGPRTRAAQVITAGATSTSGPKAGTSTASDPKVGGSSTSSRRVRSIATRP